MQPNFFLPVTPEARVYPFSTVKTPIVLQDNSAPLLNSSFHSATTIGTRLEKSTTVTYVLARQASGATIGSAPISTLILRPTVLQISQEC